MNILKKIYAHINASYPYVEALFAFVGFFASLLTIVAFFLPNTSLPILEKIQILLEERLPQPVQGGVRFLELFEGNGEDPGNTMFRYYNPSPSKALEHFTVSLYQKESGRMQKVFSEDNDYLRADTDRSIFDIKPAVD